MSPIWAIKTLKTRLTCTRCVPMLSFEWVSVVQKMLHCIFWKIVPKTRLSDTPGNNTGLSRANRNHLLLLSDHPSGPKKCDESCIWKGPVNQFGLLTRYFCRSSLTFQPNLAFYLTRWIAPRVTPSNSLRLQRSVPSGFGRHLGTEFPVGQTDSQSEFTLCQL